MLPTALMPLVIGRAIDSGIRPDDDSALLRWILAVVLLGIVQTAGSAGLSWSAHTMWLHGTTTTQRLVLRHVTRLGMTLTHKVRAGEVVSISSSDTYRVGTLFEVLGRASGSLVSFVIAAAILLWVSPLLGVVVLIGVPLATLGIGPLLIPLRRREEIKRERLSEISTLSADIVSGLRILRGIGGEAQYRSQFVKSSQRLRAAGVDAGSADAWLAAAELALTGLVTVLVTWLGAHLTLSGAISVGELVAFYGVSAFLVIPVRTATEAADELSSALVAAGRVCALLRTQPEDAVPVSARTLPPGPLPLHDEASGTAIPAAALTVIDAGAYGEALSERLAGHSNTGRVFADGVPLAQVPPDDLRRRIVLAHNQDVLFSGPLREELDLGFGVDVDVALAAADAHDVLEAMPSDVLDERGRSLSGGQRQRLVLARALCSDADVLVLDEPTSAVDAHTEARIVQRVRELRQGHTTVVITQSPLWTAVADRVLTWEGQPT